MATQTQPKPKMEVSTDKNRIRQELDAALRSQRTVYVGYKSKERGHEARRVRPMSFEQVKGKTVVVAFDAVRNQVRYLTLSRVVAVQLPKAGG